MSQRIMIRGGPFPEPDPLPVKEAAAAAVDSLKLAWEADRNGMLLIIALNTATTAAEVAQLFVSRSAVDGVIDGDRRLQARRLLVLGGLGVVATAGKSSRALWGSPVTQAANRRTESRILDVVAAMELADVEDPDFQDRLQKALMGSQRQSMLFGTALGIPQSVLGMAGSLVAMTASDRALVPLAVAGSVPRWYVMRRTQDPDAALWGRGRGREFRHTGMVRHLLTSTTAAHELRVFDATPFLRRRYEELADEADAVQSRVYRANARRDVLGSLMGRLAEAPTATRLLLRVTRKEASVAEAVAGGMAARKAAGGVHRIAETVNSMCQTAAATADVRDFIREPPARPAGRKPPGDFSRIVVRDLGFTYPGRTTPVLDGVDLDIAKGEVVALVGENGCGKTTLAKILCSLYRPAKGTIRWDGADGKAVDVADCDPAGVRARIAIVFQDFVRYSALTAAENIGIGLPAKMGDRAAIVEAARRAGAHDAIEALPKGYDTVMSRQFGGADLSTGQWQRVALARAFLRDAPLVVLDEPTAALDPRAERDLFETVASLYESRSALLISHRLSSVRFAHRICVLAGGRITESGTHDELLAAGGDYAELFELQAHSYR
jgi:ATP-binding cassette subfamily B protein